jgi:hypothetical protein
LTKKTEKQTNIGKLIIIILIIMEVFLWENDINHFENSSLMNILKDYKLEYNDLMATIEEEKKKEASEINVNFQHKISDLVEISDEDVLNFNKVGVPMIITKIDSPFKEISRHNTQFVLGNKYPEKWSEKNNQELFLFRKIFLELAGEERRKPRNCILDQGASIGLISRIKSKSLASAESAVMSKFADKLMKHEITAIEKSILGTMKYEKEDYEITSDGAKNYWVLDLFEHLNKNIMMKASAKQNKKELDDSVDHYEGKRINTRYFEVGASMSNIEFEGSQLSLKIFLSATICGYFWSDEDTISIGRPEMIQYSMYVADNLFSLSLLRSFLKPEEKCFLDYYVSLLDKDEEVRIGMGSLYETTCLLMSDHKTLSASMPLLDNLIESISVSASLTDDIVRICSSSMPETCIKMSSIGKTLVLASTNPGKGISKYTQRTNRDNPVNKDTIKRLRSLFRQKVILSYIQKHGRVPALVSVPEDLGAQLEMKAAGGNYIGQLISEVSRYDDVKLGKFLDSGNEMNLQSRIIDKACSKEEYDINNNSEKEISYYINNDMKEVFKEPMGIDKSMYKSRERKVTVIHRKELKKHDIRKYFMVRLSEKEREQKTSARFYGIASFKLKLWISSTMEMIKRAMKLLPGQMMTMTDDERRDIMYKMSEKLLSPNAYSMFLDYSGHNTSQRPENTNFLLEEVANMYGYFEGSAEFEELTSLSYVFSNIHVIVEDSWSDYIYYSQGQLGAIEGWLGGLWGIQSQLMLDDMFNQLGVKDYLGTTYSDDSCGVFTQANMTVSKLNDIVRNVQRFGENMGLIVKLSQTQVTNGRCSMLKEHYYKGEPVEMTLKKMMSISPNGPKLLYDELESAKLIDSGYTSSCSRSTDIMCQTLMRNIRIAKLLASPMRRYLEKIVEEDLDKRYLSSINDYEISVKMAVRSMSSNIHSKPFIPAPRSRNIEFYQFHIKNKNILDAYLMLMYGPYTTYGFALTPMPDVHISGFSLSNIKRLSYLQGILSSKMVSILGSFVNISGSASSYIENSFPLVGGRKDTALLLKPEIKKMLPRRVKNPELLKFLNMYSKEEEDEYREKLVITFSNCFSSRIVSKFYESSLFSYVDEVVSKIDNAATMKMLLGGRKMMKIINDAWSKNHRVLVKRNNSSVFNYDELIYERDIKQKKFRNGNTVDIRFISIEEIPIMGKVFYSEYKTMIQPIFKGNTVLTEKGRKLHSPQRTFMNSAKFDREIGIEGMFEHKLIFKAYDLVRYVKWIMMEQEKFSDNMGKEDKIRLIKLCDETLKTFTDAKYEDMEPHVVCPKGGRYFHRASAGGFNPKTGDMSSNLITGNYDITGVDQLLSKTGGVDNNLNVQYLMIYIKVCLSLLQPEPWKIKPLTLSTDIVSNIKDVSFKLRGLNDISPLPHLYNITSKERIKNKGKMYYNYSTFVEGEEDIDNKFISHTSTTRFHFVEKESSFRAVHAYMLDQMILSPELVSDEIFQV